LYKHASSVNINKLFHIASIATQRQVAPMSEKTVMKTA